jgi:uncharacterized protein (DUF58 family)
VLTHRGAFALFATIVALGLALYTLSVLLLLGAVAAFGLVAGEVLLFERSPPNAANTPFEIRRRDGPRVVSPGVEVTDRLTVTFRGTQPVRAEVRELLPASLPVSRGRSATRRWWRPGASADLDPTLRAGVRGSHHLGPVTVVAESPHGFAWRQWQIRATDRPLRVVPPAPIERSYRMGPALETRVQGRLALRHRGFGTEFRSLRPYQPEDDIRHVAWKRSRLGQLYVREFDQENRQDFLLLVDLSLGMAAGLPGESALDRAVEAGSLVTAAVARTGEDRVGLMTQSGTHRQFLRPSRGERYYARPPATSSSRRRSIGSGSGSARAPTCSPSRRSMARWRTSTCRTPGSVGSGIGSTSSRPCAPDSIPRCHRGIPRSRRSSGPGTRRAADSPDGSVR